MPKPPIDLYIGDVVQMRKPHPCGGDTWRIVRLGAEIGIRCLTCERKVLLPRATFERRVRRFLQRGAPGNTPEPEGTEGATEGSGGDGE
ncbi:MAG TPA: DUF951 domain-containing protein [Roseiflexaceae bacterium]|nr:DUF951 domain-containing protein [Roseiflexaceae bacterium]